MNTLHESGILNTSAPRFSDDDIRIFVAVFDAQARVKGKSAGMFLSRDGCRQSYVMPASVKYKTPKVRAQDSEKSQQETEFEQKEEGTKTEEPYAKMLHILKILAGQKNQVAIHLLQLWNESEHNAIRVMIDHGGNDACDRAVHQWRRNST